MNIRLLAHASLLVEHAGASVLVDPWLQGSCYDRSWELVPPPGDLVDALPRPDWIAYTHAHPDHFHLPTLRRLLDRFGRNLPIVVPRHAVGSMGEALRREGCLRVREASLRRPFRLGNDLTLTYMAARADDAAQVFKGGSWTLVNANDCRFEGRMVADLARIAGPCDVLTGQFSLADGYPYRLDGMSEDDLRQAATEPLDHFRSLARSLGARHVVPTASFMQFAHEDNADLNRWLNTLEDVARAFEGDESLAILYPGDEWRAGDGCVREPAHRDAYECAVERMRRGAVPLTARESPPDMSELRQTAERRCRDMFAKLPVRARQRIGRLGFHLEDVATSVTVDWPAQNIEWGSSLPDAPFYRLSAGHFLRVCAESHGWSTLHIACKFTVHGWRQSGAIEAFMPASILYSLGYFDSPFRLFRLRALGAAWSRRREILDLAMRAARGRAWAGSQFRRL